ncbi:TonB-dependent receptor [Methylocella sp.]|uniref:TonB-dependent receptor n=1 Tax=Methylocella sp. TaxID=1978226 RepID=UPI0037836B72
MSLIRPLSVFVLAAGALAAAPRAALADPAAADAIALDPVEVASRELDAARTAIQPSLGAATYRFDENDVKNMPQGENAALNRVLLRAPGVVQDSFGQIHVRGDHANVQYRINGVQLPEGLSIFGQVLQTRIAREITLMTGALPAQYGFLTGAVVDIEAKTGRSNPGLGVTAYGGSFAWAQPSVEYGGRHDNVDWFLTGEYLQNRRGVENPAPTFDAAHDQTSQLRGFAIMNATLDADTRVSVFGGAFSGYFQIPAVAGLTPELGFSLGGRDSADSARLNQSQVENTQFGALVYQKRLGEVDAQISAFVRNSALSYAPDTAGELLFNGIAQSANRENFSGGAQGDASWRVAPDHTLRGGFLGQATRVSYGAWTNAFAVDAEGAQAAGAPLAFSYGEARTGGLYGVYLQDEWRVAPQLTLNYGLRFDGFDGPVSETQLSPRVNVVWTPTPATTLHAGYARYFVPPAFDRISSGAIALYAGTSAAPALYLNDPVRSERSHYFDAGISQALAPGLAIGVNGYYKLARNLLDEGQFGAPIILSGFNYARAQVGGAEFTASYSGEGWTIYANAAWSRAMGEDINSAQFNFDPQDLAYIAQHYIHLDHDQTWTASAGASYAFNADSPFATRVSADVLVQSGLRTTISNVPNGASLPQYAVVNLGFVQKLGRGFGESAEARLDILNVGDARYQIRDGSGVGVGAPQWGLRRAVLAGLTQRF